MRNTDGGGGCLIFWMFRNRILCVDWDASYSIITSPLCYMSLTSPISGSYFQKNRVLCYKNTNINVTITRLATHDDDSGLSLDLRTAFRFGTWNVLSLGEQGCDLLVVRELSRLHLSITALTEVRWPGSGTKTVANSTMLWSGRSDNNEWRALHLHWTHLPPAP